MDEDLILREIIKSLAFEIEAVNQDNVIKWTTTNGTPLSVKVRVRNNNEPRLVQKGTIPVPRIGITAPEQLTLVSSDQTILSFRVFMENELQKKVDEKRYGGFKMFNIGTCLGTYSDDEGPYLPSSSNENTLESDNNSTSSRGTPKKKPLTDINTSKTTSRTPKRFLGKCKPGGCLDPPFDEDNYAYGLPKTDRQEKLRHEIGALQDDKKSCKPGGCLDPPFGEESYPYAHQKQNIIINGIKNSNIEPQKKIGKCSENETLSQNPTKDENDRKNENELLIIHSNSIITYPTEISSNETLDQSQGKKISVKSVDNESLRQSNDYPESYFVPPKDIKRYKEEDRKNVRKFSTEQLLRSSLITAHNSINKSKNEYESDKLKCIPQIERNPKDEQMEQAKIKDLKTDTDPSPEVSLVKKGGNDTRTQLSISIETPLSSKNENVTDRIIPTKNETSMLKVPQQVMKTHDTGKRSKTETRNFKDNISAKEMQVKPDTQSDLDVNIQSDEIKSQLGQSRDFPGSNTQILHKNDVNVENHDELSKNLVLRPKSLKTDIQSDKNEDKILPIKEEVIACGILPIEATIGATIAAMMKSEKEPLQSIDKPNIDSSTTKEENEISLSEIYPQSRIEINNQQRFQEKETKNVSNYTDLQQTQKNDNKVSSIQHNDSKQETSITGRVDEILDSKKSKQLSPTRNVITEKTDTKDNSIKHLSDQGGNKTSAILQKKPFITRQGSGIHNEDINRITPLKRNTFTIIGSKTSLQKRDENEERTESITTVLPKSNENANFITARQADGNKNILDKTSTEIDGITHTNSNEDTIKINKRENLKELNSNVNDTIKSYSTEYNDIIEERSKIDTEKSENNSITDFNDSQQPNKRLEPVKNWNPTNYQEKTSDSMTDKTLTKREIHTDSLQKPIPINIESRYTATTEDDKSTRTSQMHPDDVTDIKNENEPSTKHKDCRVSDFLHDNLAPSKEYLKNINYINSSEMVEPLSVNKKHSNDMKDNGIISSNPTRNEKEYSYTNDAENNNNENDNDLGVDLTLLQNKLMLKDTADSGFVPIPSNVYEKLDIEAENLKNLPYIVSAKNSEQKSVRDYKKYSYSEFNEGNKSNDVVYDLLRTENANEGKKTLEINKKTGIQHLSVVDKFAMQSETGDTLELLENGKGLPSDVYTKPHNIENAYVNAHDDKHSSSDTRIPNTPDNVAMEDKSKNIKSPQKSLTKIENALNHGIVDVDKMLSDSTRDNLETSGQELQSSSNLVNVSAHTDISAQDQGMDSAIQEKYNLKYDETGGDDSVNMTPGFIQNVYAQTAVDDADVFDERKHDTTHFYLDTKTDQHQVDISDIVGENCDLSDMHKKKSDNQNVNHSIRSISEEPVINNENGEFNETAEDGKLLSNSPDDAIDTGLQELHNISSNVDSISTDKFDDKMWPKDQIHKEQNYLFYSEVSHEGSYIDDSNLNIPDKNLGFEGKIRNVSKNNSPYSGYSGQISEALSNISENIEGEEKYSRLNLGSEEKKGNYVSNSQAERDGKIFYNKFAVIDKEPEFIASTLSSDNIDASQEDKYVIENVSRYSFAENDMSVMKEGDDNIPIGTVAKVIETTEFIAFSPDKLTKGSKERPIDALTKDQHNGVLDTIINITDQSGVYQSCKKNIPVSHLNELNKDYLVNTSSLGLNGPLKHDRQNTFSKLSKIESIERQRQFDNELKKSHLGGTASKKDRTPVYLDMSFYSYMNDNNQRVVQTQSSLIEQPPPNNDGTVTVVKTLIRHRNEIRIPVDKENDLSLNILEKDGKTSRKGSIAGISIKTSRREKHVVDRAKRHDDVLNKNLALIYEYELIPLHNVIKNLRQEVNTLSVQQESLQTRMRNVKRTKSLRLIPVVKRCGCRRM